MVDALASDRSDQPFGEAVLPRRARGDGLVTNAHGTEPAFDEHAVDPIPIAEQVARGLSPRECLCDLTCDPFRGRMWCDVDPDKVSALQPNDDEDIEQLEANGRDNEQVHGGDVRRVVTQEGAPSLGRRSTPILFRLPLHSGRIEVFKLQPIGRTHSMVCQVLHEHATALSATVRANRSCRTDQMCERFWTLPKKEKPRHREAFLWL